jgi:hypothetical protein
MPFFKHSVFDGNVRSILWNSDQDAFEFQARTRSQKIPLLASRIILGRRLGQPIRLLAGLRQDVMDRFS